MKLLNAALALGLCTMVLSGCDGIRKVAGLNKKSPDEFAVTTKAPLVIPPDFALVPPQPGAARPQDNQATAQTLDALFGGFGGRPSRSLPPQASSFASPFDFSERRSSSGGEYSGGGGQAFCVRTCDGRYFPLQRNAHASPAELCKSFCPAARTMVFISVRSPWR